MPATQPVHTADEVAAATVLYVPAAHPTQGRTPAEQEYVGDARYAEPERVHDTMVGPMLWVYSTVPVASKNLTLICARDSEPSRGTTPMYATDWGVANVSVSVGLLEGVV